MERVEIIKNQCVELVEKVNEGFKGFPQRLKDLRENRVENRVGFKLKQNEIAKITGQLAPNYNRVEKGFIKPSVDLLIQLSEVFGVSIDYLVKGEMAAQKFRREQEPSKKESENQAEPRLSKTYVVEELLKSKDQHIDVLNMLVKQLQDENKRLVSMAAK